MRLLSWALLLASAVVWGQNHKNDWEFAGLKNKVKSGGQTEYKTNENGELVEQGHKFKANFNKKGFITDMEYKTPNGEFKTIIKFDKNGYRVQSETFSKKDGKIVSKSVRTNNAQGKVTSDQNYDEQGNPTMKETFAYNKKGLNTEKQMCYATQCFHKEVHSYDKKGNIITSTYYNSENKITQIVYNTYDKKGNKIHAEEKDADGNLLYKYDFAYDKNQNQTQMKIFNSEGELEEQRDYTYEYDKKKNWTKKTEFINGKLSGITEQFVEYF